MDAQTNRVPLRRSRLAIWSFVFAVLVFFTCGFTATLALGLGIAGLASVARSRGALGGADLRSPVPSLVERWSCFSLS